MSEIDQNITRYIQELERKIDNGLELVGQAIENKAKENCPVDDGTLRASITHRVNDGKSVTVGTNCEYAPFVHEGTGIYAEGGKGRQTPWVYTTADGKTFTTKGQKAQPFLQDAADRMQGQILNLFARGVVR